MTREDIQKVMNDYPTLDGDGFTYIRRKDALNPDVVERVAESRQYLLDSAERCSKIVEWLSDKPRTKKVNSRAYSYTLKHIIERDIGYVSNGQFLAAAIHIGLKIQQHIGSPNATVNLAVRGFNCKPKNAT